MISMVPFEAVPANTSTEPTSSDTWISDAFTEDKGPSGDKPFDSIVRSRDGFGNDATDEFQTELTHMRRQNMMMMGGTVVTAGLVILGVLGIAGLIIGVTMLQDPEQVIVEVPGAPIVTVKAPPPMVEPKAEVKPEETIKVDVPPEIEPVKKVVATRPPPVKKVAPIKTAVVMVEAPATVLTPDPAVRVEPVLPPEPPKPTGASISLDGDARMVMLVSSTGKFKSSESIPPGDYAIQAWFGSPNPVAAGRLTISGPGTIKLKCISMMAQCVRQ